MEKDFGGMKPPSPIESWVFSDWDIIGIWNLEFGICRAAPIRGLRNILGAMLLMCCFGSPLAHGATLITDCSEDALRSALLQGESVNFSNDCSITLSDT